MGTITQTLDIARSTLGEHEDPPGSNRIRFASWAGIPGLAWCGAWLCWVLDQSGSLDVPRFVWTPSGADSYRKGGRWGSQPKPGAVLFFQWPGMARISHVGLVEATRLDGGVVTLEGNTDEAGGGSGGKVMRHVRRANIVGYGYPKYIEALPDAPQPPLPVQRPMIKRGSRGPNVMYLQQKLGGLSVDGIFGPATEQRVRQFQRNHRLSPDGIVGPKTWAAIG